MAPVTDNVMPPLQHTKGEGEDSSSRPAFSYATLIGMAIKAAPSGKCTLREIYDYITENHPYYRDGNGGDYWQNSIRHNLTVNKAFVKTEVQFPARTTSGSSSTGRTVRTRNGVPIVSSKKKTRKIVYWSIDTECSHHFTHNGQYVKPRQPRRGSFDGNSSTDGEQPGSPTTSNEIQSNTSINSSLTPRTQGGFKLEALEISYMEVPMNELDRLTSLDQTSLLGPPRPHRPNLDGFVCELTHEDIRQLVGNAPLLEEVAAQVCANRRNSNHDLMCF